MTPDGEFRAHRDAALAQRERGTIGLRTREGMAEKKRQGVHLGHSVAADFLPTYQRVIDLHTAGESMNAIARTLNADDVSTAKGGKWYASTVRATVTSETAKGMAA